MASHAKSAALNGHAPIGPIKTLERLAQYHERRAAAIREAIDAFAEFRGAKKRQTLGATLGEAIEIDRERRAPARRKKPAKRRDKFAKAARRARSAALLGQFSQTEPRSGRGLSGAQGIAPLLLHGYLRPKGAGYVRTAKPFEP